MHCIQSDKRPSACRHANDRQAFGSLGEDSLCNSPQGKEYSVATLHVAVAKQLPGRAPYARSMPGPRPYLMHARVVLVLAF